MSARRGQPLLRARSPAPVARAVPGGDEWTPRAFSIGGFVYFTPSRRPATTGGIMAGGSMMSGATPSSTPQHNQEPPRGNHLCNQKTVERAYSLHRGKMERSASTTSFGVPPRQYEFLDSKISKNYKAQFEGRRTMKENQQLLAKMQRGY